MTLAHALGLVAGVHFSARHLRIAVADVAYTVVTENHMPLAKDHRADNEMDRVLLLLADMLESVGASVSELIGLGIAIPAPIDAASGTISRTGIMRGWDALAIGEVMERRLKRPVFVDNAANLGALAEHRLGSARGKDVAVYIEADEGIGAGIIIGGRVYRGGSGIAGELGHTIVDPDGPSCRCGNRGCLETVAGGRAILQSLVESHGNLKLQDLIVKAMSGDDACVRAIANAGRQIGVAAGNLCNVLDPERVVVGGELARSGELLLGPLRREAERAVLSAPTSVPEVMQGQLGRKAAMLGAIANAIDHVQV